MATIVLRSVKGSPLTIAEADANFNNLNTEVGTKLNSSSYTAPTILSMLEANDAGGDGQGLNAATLASKSINTANTADTIVLRDVSGGINATQFNGPVVGNVTGNLTGNVTGNVSGTALNVTSTVTIEHGGTGGTTASTARTNLGLGTMATQGSSSVSITGGTITGIADVAIADGGTGASTATQARTNLGLVIGADVQPFSNELTGIAAAVSTGFYVRTGSAAVTQRSITVGGNGLSVTYGDGVSGNPLISIPTSAAMTLAALSTNTLTASSTVTITGGLYANGSINTTTISASGAVSVATLSASSTVHAGSYLYSYGNIYAQGNVIGYYSDDRLKTKLGRITNALDKLCSLEGFYYKPNETAQKLGYTDQATQVGVSAQQVQAILPEVIHPAPVDSEYMTVDYAHMVPLIIEAIKEIREEIRSLK